MSDTFQVTQGERGLVRLFAVDLPRNEVDDLREADLARALGIETVDVDQIDLFSTDDLKGLGLVAYMIEGLGIAETELAGDRARLEALTGVILVVRSAAFKGQYTVLTAQAPLRWIGTYAEESSPVQFEPLPAGGAKGEVTPKAKKPPSDAAMSGRVAMLALLVIFALTALIVWVAA